MVYPAFPPKKKMCVGVGSIGRKMDGGGRWPPIFCTRLLQQNARLFMRLLFLKKYKKASRNTLDVSKITPPTYVQAIVEVDHRAVKDRRWRRFLSYC